MSVLELRVTLDYVEPRVERTLHVPAAIRLDRLHTTLQAAMGWTDTHLYLFETGGATWSLPDDEFPNDDLPVHKTTLIEVLEDTGSNTLRYLYDFGDGWEHTLTVCQSLQPEWGYLYPRLIHAIGTCPPEDIGGVPGYQDFLDAIADPNHPEHKSYANGYDENFEPNNPPVEALTHNVNKLAKR